ncbi:restriction endonuclease subunit S [Aeromonas sp. Y318-1]|uniref:restriction endonuclease subunit S n=1 Tax=Aeromonas TaxID=642 RepID=UPI0022E2EF19|nr:restriction endonuclease subunit S [Aeromonas sp. Y318-1]
MIAAEPKTTGQYQPYPEYKDSGVEWLGDIPSHWLTSKMRYMFTFGKGLTITKEHLRDEGIPCINYGEVHSKYGFEVDPVKHPLRCVEEDYLKTSSRSVLNVGDFVFADTSEDIDGSGNFTQLTSDVVTFAGYHTIIVRPIDKDSHRFFAYLFDSKEFRTAIRHAVKGVKVFSITQAILRGADIWLPSQDERQGIAAFLDYETARIDRLIAQQQRLIELLKEKRLAVISHAVTKGLNPNAPMKDSGVEWLGQVPEHWEVTRSKFVSEIFVPQRNKPELNDIGDGIFWATMEDMKNDEINETRRFVSSDAATISGSKVLQKGAVVASCVGNFGVAALLNVDVIINQQLQAYIPKAISGQYLRDLISISKTYFELVGTAATLIYVNQEGFGNMPVTRPPIEEQLEIEKYNNKIKEKFEHAIAKGELQVSLLQERRTALISAAVTGKIDLRGWTPPVEEVAA